MGALTTRGPEVWGLQSAVRRPTPGGSVLGFFLPTRSQDRRNGALYATVGKRAHTHTGISIRLRRGTLRRAPANAPRNGRRRARHHSRRRGVPALGVAVLCVAALRVAVLHAAMLRVAVAPSLWPCPPQQPPSRSLCAWASAWPCSPSVLFMYIAKSTQRLE